MEVAGNMFPTIIGLKLPVVKARVPNQKRPREWRVGLKILGGRLVIDGRSEAMMANCHGVNLVFVEAAPTNDNR